jgi:hypothetical protein
MSLEPETRGISTQDAPPDPDEPSPSPSHEQPGIPIRITNADSDDPSSHPRTKATRGPYRARATDFQSELERILGKEQGHDSYWFIGTVTSRRGPQETSTTTTHRDLQPPTEVSARIMETRRHSKNGLSVPDARLLAP